LGLGEKLSRIKLSSRDAAGFGTFEALEILELGIHGKLALWRVLAVLAEADVRLQSADYARLAARAETQESLVEQQRLKVARTAFRSNK
jgi:ABC-type hemin transport system ATPase subunit